MSTVNVKERDDEFYMEFVTLEVQNILFKVPVGVLESRSEAFRDMLSVPKASDDDSNEGGSDQSPIVLEGVDVSDFRALLRYLFPKEMGEVAEFTTKEWISILALAHMWGFQKAEEASKAYLLSFSDAVTKMEIGTKYDYKDLSQRAYEELAMRPQPLNELEASRVGLHAAMNICRLRESRLEWQLRRRVLAPNPHSGAYASKFCPSCSQCLSITAGQKNGGTSRCDMCNVVYFETDSEVKDFITKQIREEVMALFRLRVAPLVPRNRSSKHIKIVNTTCRVHKVVPLTRHRRLESDCVAAPLSSE